MDGTQRLYRGMYYVRVFNVINREIACTYTPATRKRSTRAQPTATQRQPTPWNTRTTRVYLEAAQASGIKDFKNMRYCYSKHVTCVCTLCKAVSRLWPGIIYIDHARHGSAPRGWEGGNECSGSRIRRVSDRLFMNTSS